MKRRLIGKYEAGHAFEKKGRTIFKRPYFCWKTMFNSIWFSEYSSYARRWFLSIQFDIEKVEEAADK
jgi:hypothetical protein